MKRLLLTLIIVLPLVAQRSSPTQTLNSGKNALGMEFVKIAPGEFMMGCSAGDSDCDADEKPEHRVQITKAFEIGKYEVTQFQWQALMGSNPSTIKGDDHPVETVSKQDADDFLAKLTARNDGYRYRLPTEAEWSTRPGLEHRCRQPWMKSPGTQPTRTIPRMRWARRNRTHGVCMTC